MEGLSTQQHGGSADDRHPGGWARGGYRARSFGRGRSRGGGGQEGAEIGKGKQLTGLSANDSLRGRGRGKAKGGFISPGDLQPPPSGVAQNGISGGGEAS